MKRAAVRRRDDGVVFLELPFAEGLLARARDGRVCVELTPDAGGGGDTLSRPLVDPAGSSCAAAVLPRSRRAGRA